MKGKWAGIKYHTILANFKLRKRTNISILEYKAFRIKSKFGVDYLNLVGDSAPVYDLQDCLGQKLQEFFVLHEQIKEIFEEIKEKELQINRKIKAAHGIVEDDSETSIEDDSDTTEKEVQPIIEEKVQLGRNSKSKATHDIKDDNDANEKTIRWKTPSKSALGTKLSSDKKADTTNYDSDSGNTAEMTLSDHSRPLRTALKGPGERKYGVRGERRRKKGTRSPRNSNGSSSSHGSRGSFGSGHSRGKVVTTTTGRQKRKPKRSGQRNSNGSSDHSRGNAKVVTTRTRPKGKPKNAQRNSFDSDSGSVKVVTTRTRPKLKKEPSQ